MDVIIHQCWDEILLMLIKGTPEDNFIGNAQHKITCLLMNRHFWLQQCLCHSHHIDRHILANLPISRDIYLISYIPLCRCVTNSSHYSDVMMSTMASQITSLTIVYSTVYSRADQWKYQSSASLAFVRGNSPVTGEFPHKGPVTRKMFSFDDVMMSSQNIDTQIIWKVASRPFFQGIHSSDKISSNIKALLSVG